MALRIMGPMSFDCIWSKESSIMSGMRSAILPGPIFLDMMGVMTLIEAVMPSGLFIPIQRFIIAV
ncbi:MAG: hypothetical protein CL696_12880 [Chloroflexi bacterium]|jgi:hypothetical protein|nr:hypothetical protein [Chloroflexota bacterium]|tara:strand:- start:196714 stop:196908 length:195 start_codon:yes stop_codon:yes gene_type:complete